MDHSRTPGGGRGGGGCGEMRKSDTGMKDNKESESPAFTGHNWASVQQL